MGWKYKWTIDRERNANLKSMRRCSTSFQILLVIQSCLTLCDSMDCSPSSSSVHGILQERLREWVAIHFSRGSSQPRNQTQSPALQRLLYHLSQLFIINKCKIKRLHWDTIFHLLDAKIWRVYHRVYWQSCGKQAVFCFLVRMWNGSVPMEGTSPLSSKIVRAFTLWPSNSTSRNLHNTLAKIWKDQCTVTYYSAVYKSKGLETTQMAISRKLIE